MPVVATNTAANSALRYLNNNSAMASGSVGKLASGSRIVKASDDAAGLAIGTRLKADVTALTQAGINAAQGASVVQVADGGLARIGDVLQRMKALAAQSLSGVPTDTARGFIEAEFQQLVSEISDIATTTRFNGQSLLTGCISRRRTASFGPWASRPCGIGSA
jgi:flagellin